MGRREGVHNGTMGFFKRAAEKIGSAYRILAENRYSTVAGTLVFFLVMSLMPFLFWLTLLFGGSALAYSFSELSLFGWAEDILILLRDSAAAAGKGVSVLFLLTTLWSSSAFFYHLRRSGEMIYRYRRIKKGWKVRLSAILITFAVLLFFAAAGVLLFAASVASRLLSPWISYPAFYALLFALGFFSAWMLNDYVCPYRIRPSETARGSLYTAIAWLLASAAFSVYLHFTDKAKLYGALTVVIVFLLWLYWMMIVFTAGVIYNKTRVEGEQLRHKTL